MVTRGGILDWFKRTSAGKHCVFPANVEVSYRFSLKIQFGEINVREKLCKCRGLWISHYIPLIIYR
jgi:hypothetical protein